VNRWRDEQVGGWAGGRQVTDNNRDGLLRIGGSSARPLPHPDSPTCPVQSSLSQLCAALPTHVGRVELLASAVFASEQLRGGTTTLN
jgi:hypothetical protein